MLQVGVEKLQGRGERAVAGAWAGLPCYEVPGEALRQRNTVAGGLSMCFRWE